jgi:hypothetical protein
MTSTTIQWPERPTCHDGDWQAKRFAPQTWRPKGEKLHPSNDLPMVFRTCSYCGSIHPEDLLEALRAGATLSQADWKYGWPHKFYVDGIPNTNEGQMREFTSVSIAGPEPTDEERARMAPYLNDPKYDSIVKQDGFNSRTGAPLYQLTVRMPDSATTHGKWYNTHLQDLNDEAFAELAREINNRTGVLFERDENGIKYKAMR